MSEQSIEIVPALTIPDFMIGEVQSKLAYVDESIASAHIVPTGDRIRLVLRRDPPRTWRTNCSGWWS